jgi:hypothetical protein
MLSAVTFAKGVSQGEWPKPVIEKMRSRNIEIIIRSKAV